MDNGVQCSGCKKVVDTIHSFRWTPCNHHYCTECAKYIVHVSLLRLNSIPECSRDGCNTLLSNTAARSLYTHPSCGLKFQRRLQISMSPTSYMNALYLVSGFIRTKFPNFIPNCIIAIISDYYQLTSIYQLIKCSQCQSIGNKKITCNKCKGKGIKTMLKCRECVNGIVTYNVPCEECNERGIIDEKKYCTHCYVARQYSDEWIDSCCECSGTGKWRRKYKCRDCHGTGKNGHCSSCNGTGKYLTTKPCSKCEGSGTVKCTGLCDYCWSTEGYWIAESYVCTECGGKKMKQESRKCRKCNSKQMVVEKCDFCCHRGIIREECNQCNGNGHILLFNLRQLIGKQILCSGCNEYHLCDNVIKWDTKCDHYFCINCLISYLTKQIVNKKIIPKCSVKGCGSKNEFSLEQIRFLQHWHYSKEHSSTLIKIYSKLELLMKERDKNYKLVCSLCQQWTSNDQLYLWTNCGHPYCSNCVLEYSKHCLSKSPSIPRCIAQNRGCKQLLEIGNIDIDDTESFPYCLSTHQLIEWQQLESKYQKLKQKSNVCIFFFCACAINPP